MNTYRKFPISLAILAILNQGCGIAEKVKGGSSSKDDPKPLVKTEPKIPATPADPANPANPAQVDPATGKQLSPLALAGALASFKDCSEAQARIVADELASMHRQIDQSIYWVEHEGEMTTDVAVGGKAEAASAPTAQNASAGDAGAASTASGPAAHTGTNNQVEGVEEGDFVKNDGTHIFHVARGKLRIHKSWPAAEIAELAAMDLDGRAFELLLDEDKHRLVVLTNPRMTADEIAEEAKRYGDAKVMALDAVAPSTSGAMVPGYPGVVNAPRFNPDKIEVLTIDVADPAKPAVTGRFKMRGSYLSSRRVGPAVRLVLQSYRPYDPAIKNYLDLPYDQQQKMTKEAKIAALKDLATANEAVIRAKDLNYWLDLSGDVKVDAAGASTPLSDVGQCANVYAPTVAAQSGLTRVASLDLDAGTMTESLLLSRVDEVYASAESLYLSTRYWWWDSSQADRDTDATFIHKFDIKSPGAAPYLASGRIAGQPLNQFSFDEFQGNLRVATTQATFKPSYSTANRVVVLAQDGTALNQIGQTEDLAPGESIMSARFQGPRGFVVTFRQVDPLFTIDLADAKAPKVMGSLKIPGYSSYLHFTDDTHLLAVGRSGNENGVNGGLKIALFDVADLAAPKELQSLTLGGQNSGPVANPDFYASSNFWSEAEWDHKAFTYFPEKKLLALPVTGYTYVSTLHFWWERYESGLFVFSVDPDSGITPTGKLGMTGLYDGSEREKMWYFDGARVNRSFFADDFVYGISDFGVRAANVSALKSPVGQVQYKCDQTCYDQWNWWAWAY